MVAVLGCEMPGFCGDSRAGFEIDKAHFAVEVALARVLLQNTPILILDEPTAALDNESEFYIQEAMKEICKQRTVIAIAHRLSTIRRADKIVVIDQGRIAEEGSHEVLMLQDGVYSMLQERAARI